MKFVRCPIVSILVYAAFFTAAAAGADSNSQLPDATTLEPNLYNPDAMISDHHAKRQSSQAAFANAEQRQKARNQEQGDWLLRGYEEQMRARNPNASKDEGTNIYYQISTDKDLAKLAGLTVFDLNNAGQKLGNLNMTDSSKNGLTLRSDVPSVPSSPSAFGKASSLTTKPLSWAATDYVSLHNTFAAPNPGSLQQFAPPADNIAPRHPYMRQNSDPTALSTPGMTAAENDPVMGRSTATLSLNLLPGESISSAKTHEGNLTLLDAPQATNMAQLQKLENASIRAPGGFKTAPPVPLNPVLFKQEHEDPPVTASPPAPIRNQIDDPRDMTFR